MAMAFERVLTEGIAQLSYLIGDDRSATAAVIVRRTSPTAGEERRRVGKRRLFGGLVNRARRGL